MPSDADFRFGPFRIDLRSRRLFRDDVHIPLKPRYFDLLLVLVEQPGALLTKEYLVQTVWKGVHVYDTSLTQGVSQVRGALDPNNPNRFIETVPRRGYRFIAEVTRVATRASTADLAALLAPHVATMESRAALETLQLDGVARARATYEELLTRRATDPRVHIGLATACLEQFEDTRADARPDTERLRLAIEHAHEAVSLDVNYANAWATLGVALSRSGDQATALAALRHAVDLEPNEWSHYLCLAWAAWGRERLNAARRLLELMPESPVARWLIATVYVPRHALAEAVREVDQAIAEFDHAGMANPGIPPIGLYWLKGLLCMERGDLQTALASFERELAIGGNYIYARETEANTRYAMGVCHMRLGDATAARAAFDLALSRVPGHAMALAGIAILTGAGEETLPPLTPGWSEQVLAHAVVRSTAGNVPGAAEMVRDALSQAAPGNAGWVIPIDPLLQVSRTPSEWAGVLALLRARAA